MSDVEVMELLGFIAAAMIVVVPIVKLNASITELNTTLDLFRNDTEKRHEELKYRVDIHGVKLDELEKQSAVHESRINSLEGHIK